MPEYLYKFVGLSKEFCESIDALPIINQGESTLEKLLRNSVMESKFSLDLQKLYTLTDNKLYFSQPGNFNDRHEHSFPMDLAYLEKLRMKNNMPANPDLAMLKKFAALNNNCIPMSYENLLKVTNSKMIFRICSLCKSWENPLMWAHYAGSGYGMCFRYNVHDKLIFRVRDSYEAFDLLPIYSNSDCTNQNPAQLFSDIKYKKTPAILNHNSLTYYNSMKKKYASFGFDLDALEYFFLCNLFSKSNNWSYEEEYRIIDISNSSEIPLKNFTNKNKKLLFTLDKVMFGYKMSDYSRLINIIKKSIITEGVDYEFVDIQHGSYKFTSYKFNSDDTHELGIDIDLE